MRFSSGFGLLFAFGVCAALSAWAAPTLEDGYDAFERGDVDTAVAIWSELAAGGNATAQLNMGQLYRLGKGVEQNDEEAVMWYIRAARNGSEIAAVTLVQMEQDGRASKMDVAAALPDEQGTAEDSLAQMTGTQQPDAGPEASSRPAAKAQSSSSPKSVPTDNPGAQPGSSAQPQPIPFGVLAAAVQSGGAHKPVLIENLDEEPQPKAAPGPAAGETLTASSQSSQRSPRPAATAPKPGAAPEPIQTAAPAPEPGTTPRPTERKVATAQPGVASKPAQATAAASQQGVASKPAQDTAAASQQDVASKPTQVAAAAPQPGAAPKSSKTPTTAANNKPQQAPALATVPATATPAAPANVAVPTPTLTTTATATATATSTTTTPTTTTTTTTATTTTTTPTTSTTPTTTTTATTPAVAAAAATAAAPAATTSPARAAAMRAGWEAALPRGSYVVQLLRSADTAPLQGYIRSRLSRLDVRPHIVETQRGGRAEYLLLLGPYASQGQANSAIGKLPKVVREGMPWPGGQPWVRTSTSIHKILPGS